MRFGYLVLATVGLAGASCMDATGPQASKPGGQPGATQVTAVSPTSLAGSAGFVLSDSVRVKVVDAAGAALPGQSVSFAVTGGGGSVSPTTVTTNIAGVAATQWTLGPTPGINTLSATSGSSSVSLTATGADGIGGTIVKVSGGTTDSLPAGCAINEPFVVQVKDNAGNPAAGATVGFLVTQGDGTVSASTVKTGSDGQASIHFRVGFTGGVNQVRAVLETSAKPYVEFSARSAPAAPNGFSVLGNRIYDPGTCSPTLFHGAARPSLEWWYGGDTAFHNVAAQLQLLKGWGGNILRLPLTQTFWLPGNTYYTTLNGGTDPSVEYRARVMSTVRAARALGLAVIIDLHATDRGQAQYDTVPDIHPMPDRSRSVPFWTDVATTFKDDGGIIFELYNEPHPLETDWVPGSPNEASWQLWLNGGPISAAPDYPGDDVNLRKRTAYTAAGMQELYNTVRAAGARNLVLIDGNHWGYNLAGVLTHRVKGYNIVYGTHPYDWGDKQPTANTAGSVGFDAEFGELAKTDPVMISEFGSYRGAEFASAGCRAMLPNTLGLGYNKAVMDYADAHQLSWVAWRFWTPPNVGAGYTQAQRDFDLCDTSSLLTDWSGTPSPSGVLVQQRLGSYR
jgi:endoglucanase